MAAVKSLSRQRQHARSENRGRWHDRLWARWQRQRLDHALAEGADARANPRLAARAAALTTRREREAVASAIYGVLKAVARDQPSVSGRAPLARRDIELHRPELLALAAQLRQAPTVAARGVAALRLLVTDGSDSPLYRTGAPRSLSGALSRAQHWL